MIYEVAKATRLLCLYEIVMNVVYIYCGIIEKKWRNKIVFSAAIVAKHLLEFVQILSTDRSSAALNEVTLACVCCL